jgi:DNA-binding transcriptional ArsR family regulator
MAHASRLCIISELATGERCVCQLTELIGADISTVSRHLSILATLLGVAFALGGAGGVEVREEFADTAYWRADLTTDDQGRIQFEVTLPDNLTTWVLIARAVSDETLVGDGLNEVVATKELQIRPVAPRFFTAGDRVVIGAVVINNSETKIEDLRLKIGVGGADVGDAITEFSASLEPGEQTRFDLPIQVLSSTDTVTLTYSAEAQATNPQSSIPNFSDSVRLTLPVNRYATPEVVASAGQVPPEGRSESVVVPDEATNQGELLVTLEPSLAEAEPGSRWQFERLGYFCVDSVESALEALIFNRTISLRDSWAKLEAKLKAPKG